MRYWLVAQIEPKPSKKVIGSICYHLLLIDLKNRTTAKTYIEATYRNYVNWQAIIEDVDNSYIVTNIALKNQKVNADSEPQTVIVASKTVMERELADHWLVPSKTTFGELFE